MILVFCQDHKKKSEKSAGIRIKGEVSPRISKILQFFLTLLDADFIADYGPENRFSKFQTFAKIFTFLLPLVCSKSPSNVLTTPCNFMSEKRRKVLRGQVKSKTDKNIEKEGTLFMNLVDFE